MFRIPSGALLIMVYVLLTAGTYPSRGDQLEVTKPPEMDKYSSFSSKKAFFCFIGIFLAGCVIGLLIYLFKKICRKKLKDIEEGEEKETSQEDNKTQQEPVVKNLIKQQPVEENEMDQKPKEESLPGQKMDRTPTTPASSTSAGTVSAAPMYSTDWVPQQCQQVPEKTMGELNGSSVTPATSSTAATIPAGPIYSPKRYFDSSSSDSFTTIALPGIFELGATFVPPPLASSSQRISQPTSSLASSSSVHIDIPALPSEECSAATAAAVIPSSRISELIMAFTDLASHSTCHCSELSNK